MKNLQARITRLEEGASDKFNDFFYGIACQFADSQGKPLPKKQSDIVLTLKELSGVLPK